MFFALMLPIGLGALGLLVFTASVGWLREMLRSSADPREPLARGARR